MYAYMKTSSSNLLTSQHTKLMYALQTYVIKIFPAKFMISCGGKASCRLAFTNIMRLRYLSTVSASDGCNESTCKSLNQ